LSQPDLLRYQSIAVLQYGCTIDALYIRSIQGLQNLGNVKMIFKGRQKLKYEAGFSPWSGESWVKNGD